MGLKNHCFNTLFLSLAFSSCWVLVKALALSPNCWITFIVPSEILGDSSSKQVLVTFWSLWKSFAQFKWPLSQLMGSRANHLPLHIFLNLVLEPWDVEGKSFQFHYFNFEGLGLSWTKKKRRGRNGMKRENENGMVNHHLHTTFFFFF